MNALAMLHQADQMEANAKNLRRLANALGEMPTPLGAHVLVLAQALRPYGLCLIHRDALEVANTALQAFDSDESDHPQEAYRQQVEALMAVGRAIHPQQPEKGLA